MSTILEESEHGEDELEDDVLDVLWVLGSSPDETDDVAKIVKNLEVICKECEKVVKAPIETEGMEPHDKTTEGLLETVTCTKGSTETWTKKLKKEPIAFDNTEDPDTCNHAQ